MITIPCKTFVRIRPFLPGGLASQGIRKPEDLEK